MRVVTYWRSASLLHKALLVSLLIHGVVLSIRFTQAQSPSQDRKDDPVLLDVVLVNTTNPSPLNKANKAKTIAQTSLDGAGFADTGRATSPLPFANAPSDLEIEQQEAQRALQSMRLQQNHYVAQIKKQLATLTLQTDNIPPETNGPDQVVLIKRLQGQLAAIENRIAIDNARPRKYFASPAVKEAAYAHYVDFMRRAIEHKGTQHFPQDNGAKMYGELTMLLTINHQGRLIAATVVNSSGNKALDRRAQAIARSAGPFGVFTAAMRKSADQLELVSRFRFTRDDTVQTQWMQTP